MAVSDSEMNRMQQDAIRRVREMQARAMQYQSGGQPDRRSDAHAQQRQSAQSARSAPAERREPPGAQTQGQHAPQNTATQPDRSRQTQREQTAARPSPDASGRETGASNQGQAPQAQPPVSAPPAAMRPANPVTDIFQMLFRDSDRTLLLALILILSEEKCDPGLLFALLYIAL